MQRIEIIDKLGKEHLVSNIENGEFSYQQEIERKLAGHYKLDIRFFNEKMNLAVLIETKQNFKEKDKEQLFDYVKLEQELKTLKIIAILANTNNNKINVWKILNGKSILLEDTKLKSFEEYNDYFKKRNINDKTAVLENTSQLNNLLHDNGIDENLRSQFVGTCLLALKNGLTYKDNTTNQIIAGIKEQLEIILAANSSLEKSEKLNILWKNVLQSQTVKNIESNHFGKILEFIEENILPYIDEYSNEGQDILSYFFTTFNKYVGRKDKNQAFTPNHIAHFMCKVGKPKINTRVLDPTCGSGTFLVQAMTQILSYCETEEERNNVKKKQIYGIEYDETVYGLSTTNMLIHSDGNSNIKNKSCFDLGDWIEESGANLVLMNPPYNASKKHVTKEFAKKYGSSSTDPSKGFFYVNFVANHIKQGKLITLLPMSCAIKTDGIIKEFKEKMLENNTLEAVFSFPSEMFYPGASAVACCMVFDLGRPHTKDDETFFGYYKEDGFEKRKGVGRIDIKGWKEIEKEWLYLYEHKLTKVGMSVTKHVTAEDEWCAEAYMETDYSTLTEEDFILKLRDYAAFLVQSSNPQVIFNTTNKPVLDNKYSLNTDNWKWFNVGQLFEIESGKCNNATELLEEGEEIAYIGAKKSNNGLMAYCKRSEDLVSKGNGIVFIGDGEGSVGYCTYQPKDFIGSSTISVGYNNKLNSTNALFFIAVLDKERYRYSFGRKYRQTKVKATHIKLPATQDGVPDWQFMENYIKSLPYSRMI